MRSTILYLAAAATLAAISGPAMAQTGGGPPPQLATATFWPAEDYHQHYYLKNPLRYKFYRTACGRDRRLEELWGRQDHPS